MGCEEATCCCDMHGTQGSTGPYKLVRAEGEAAHTCKVLHPAARAASPQWWLAAVSAPGKHAESHWLLHTCRPEQHPAGPRLGACGRSPHGAGTSLPALPSACRRTQSAASTRCDGARNGQRVPQVVSNKDAMALCTYDHGAYPSTLGTPLVYKRGERHSRDTAASVTKTFQHESKGEAVGSCDASNTCRGSMGSSFH